MAINESVPITVSDNSERITLGVSDGNVSRTISDEETKPYYVGAEISVERENNGTKVTAKDKHGTTTSMVYDGERGADGQDGFSPEVTIAEITGGHSVTITDEDHPSGQSFYVMDGVNYGFVYTQPTPSAEWTVEHNLDKYPAVAVVDSAGSVVEGDCNYVDTNTVVITFSGAFSGKAYLN